MSSGLGTGTEMSLKRPNVKAQIKLNINNNLAETVHKRNSFCHRNVESSLTSLISKSLLFLKEVSSVSDMIGRAYTHFPE